MAKQSVAQDVETFEASEREALMKEIMQEMRKPKKAKSLQEAEQSRRSLKKLYHSEPKMRFSASPLYRDYFGDVMKIGINGFAVYVPLNGESVMIPKSFYTEGIRKLKLVDEYELKREKRADIHNNIESSPGELRLV